MKLIYMSAVALSMFGFARAATAFEYLGHEYLTYSTFIPERMPSLSFINTGAISPPPPAITYTFRFTSSVPILSAKVGEYGYYYANFYEPGPGGSWLPFGGVDDWNHGIAPGDQCIFNPYCRSISFSGNTVIFSITDAPTHTLEGFENGVSEMVTWLRDEDFTVETPLGATGRFTFERLLSGVPEPTTWAMMLLGFGGIGLALRRQRAMGRG